MLPDLRQTETRLSQRNVEFHVSLGVIESFVKALSAQGKIDFPLEHHILEALEKAEKAYCEEVAKVEDLEADARCYERLEKEVSILEKKLDDAYTKIQNLNQKLREIKENENV